jgi:hypothetical protein
MTVLYTVRSRFNDPAREADWNEWYAGHLGVLLGVPGFEAAQRFHSTTTVDDRPYLAMYAVAGPEVFESEAYLAIWGFDEWRPLIDHWTRDLFEPIGGGSPDFAVPLDGRLRAAFLSGPREAVRDAVGPARGGLVAGLDRSCDAVAWEVVAAGNGEPGTPLEASGVQVAEAVYQPITECLR